MVGRLGRIVLRARDILLERLPLSSSGHGVLTGPEIERQVALGSLLIEPFDRGLVGPNSVDLHLGDELFVYGSATGSVIAEQLGDAAHFLYRRSARNDALDPRGLPEICPVPKQEDGRWLLHPGRLYLGATLEYTEAHGFLPVIDGRSSLGRLGVFAHVTAGRGDDGFCGRWTVEICVVEPVLLEPRGRYFQLTYHTLFGTRRPYVGRYQGDLGPVGSRITRP